MTSHDDAYSRRFVPGTVRGCRSWTMTSTGRLQSLFKPYAWVDGVNVAKCLRGTVRICADRGFHETHDETCYKSLACDGGIALTCECGFYARTDYVTEYSTATPPPIGATANYRCRVSGVVEGYGKAVVGTQGFRSSHARILALGPLSVFTREPSVDVERLKDEAHEMLSFHYPSAVIYPTMAELFTAYPLTPVELEEVPND